MIDGAAAQGAPGVVPVGCGSIPVFVFILDGGLHLRMNGGTKTVTEAEVMWYAGQS